MSLSTFAAPLALSLITDAGFAVSFSRTTAGLYDPISNTSDVATVVTWSGTAIWTRNEHRVQATTSQASGTGLQTVYRTLLLAGLSVSLAPIAGDVATIAGTQYNVQGVTFVGDADGGSVPAYRVEVTT